MRTLPAMSIGVLLTACVSLVGCKTKPPKPPPPPPPVMLTFAFRASSDVNPDAQSRPSPVVVRFYELKDDAAFKDADIYALFDKEQATLGSALVVREEYELAPGEHRTKSLQLPPEVHFMAVVAAYRDI